MRITSTVPSLYRAARRLRNNPAFTLATVLCLGLGIAVLAAMAAVTDAFLLRPLPFAEPDRLVSVWKTFDDEGIAGLQYFLKPDDFRFLREEIRQLDVAAVKAVDVDVTGDGEPVRVAAGWSTAELAPVLGLRPVLGRFFTADEERAGRGVAVISRSWWLERWGGDPGVLGASLTVEGSPYTVVGVLADEASFPDEVAVWLPMREEDWQGRLGVSAIGRLADGVTAESARQEVLALGERLREIDPRANATAGLDAAPLQASLMQDLRPALLGLLAAAAAFLVIALANGASLVVARAVRGRGETAVRVALGAGPGALTRQIACELGLLVALASGLGLFLAGASLQALFVLSPLPTFSFVPVRLDVRVVAGVLGLAAITTVVLVAAHMAVSAVRTVSFETRQARAPRQRRLLAALVVADLAITVLMLLASGHAAASVDRMLNRDSGLRPEGLVTAGVSASRAWAETHAQRVAFVDRVLEETSALPGVTSAAAVHALPMTEPEYYWSFRMADRPEDDADARDSVLFRVVAGDYFATLGMRIVEGRGILPSDVDGAPRVVWANRAFVARYWPDEPAVGQRLVSARGGDPLRVVGVVSDVSERGLAEPSEPCLYWPMAQYDRRYLSRMRLVVRAETPPEALVDGLRRRLGEIDAAAVLFDVRPMDEIVVESVGRERFIRLLLALLAVLAVAQAAAGVYGLTHYDVASRTRELGLRFALGASRRRLVRLILGDGLRQAALGFGLGAVAAWALNHALDATWRIGAIPHTTYGWVAVLLAAVVVSAALPAARRATRVDPAVTLRAD